MANPTVMGGTSPAQGMDLTNPNIINMIKAMQLAQYQGQQGEAMQQQGDNSPTGTQFVPAANQYAPARAIKQSMLVPASGAIEKMTGSYMQQKAMQNQIALAMAMQQARDNQKFGTSPQPSPLAAAIPQGVPSGSGAPPVPPVQSGTPLPPPKGYAQAMGSIPPIAAATPGQSANITNNSIVRGPASEAAIPTPPQEANVSAPTTVGGMPLSGQANTQLASAVGSMGGLGGNTPEAPTPIASAPLSAGNPSPQPSGAPAMNAPLSTGNPNVPDGMTPQAARALSYTNPELYQKLLDAKIATQQKNAELTPEQKNAQAAGLTPLTLQQKEAESSPTAENATKMQSDIDKGADQAVDLKRNLSQMRNYFQDFTPGKAAGLRQAIAQYEVQAGSQDPDTIKLAGATEGIDKLAATQALETMKSMNAIGGGNNGGNRVEFQALLANTPNKNMTAAGAKSVMDFMDKGADQAINKQQTFNDWKKGKSFSDYEDFPTYWNKQQVTNMPNTLNNIQAPSASAPPVSPQDAIAAEMARRGLK